MISYIWDSASHLEVFSLGFESIAGIVELALALCFARVVFALRSEPTEEIKRRKERLEAALGLVAGVFFFVAIVGCWRILILSQNERIESGRQLNAMSNDLAAANQAVTNAQNAAKEALKASKQKPFKERLIACLNSIDPKIIKDLQAGKNDSGLFLKSYEATDLEKLCDEPEASEYIHLSRRLAVITSTEGEFINVNISLNPDLIKMPN